MSRKTHLKIKIKTLAIEAKYIRAEEKKALKKGNTDAFESLIEHRRGIVRTAARHNHLAYGFLRGRSYSKMEQTCRTPPNFDEIEKIAKRFGRFGYNTRWEDWRTEAMAHLQDMKAAA